MNYDDKPKFLGEQVDTIQTSCDMAGEKLSETDLVVSCIAAAPEQYKGPIPTKQQKLTPGTELMVEDVVSAMTSYYYISGAGKKKKVPR